LVLCLLKFFICAVFIFFECILYFLVNHVLYFSLSFSVILPMFTSLTDFSGGITELIGDIYHCSVWVRNWVLIFFISYWFLYWIAGLWWGCD
jgi:hypothetical protein